MWVVFIDTVKVTILHTGRLKRGDQLLEVNGRSLLGVSNARYMDDRSQGFFRKN